MKLLTFNLTDYLMVKLHSYLSYFNQGMEHGVIHLPNRIDPSKKDQLYSIEIRRISNAHVYYLHLPVVMFRNIIKWYETAAPGSVSSLITTAEDRDYATLICEHVLDPYTYIVVVKSPGCSYNSLAIWPNNYMFQQDNLIVFQKRELEQIIDCLDKNQF